jgi:hypothetical protein
MSDIEVIEGEPVQRHELDGLAADEVARKLGHESFHGVSIEPGVVVVHIQAKRKLRQVRHQIGG